MNTTEVESLSPFELSLYLEHKVKPVSDKQLLNAGRGNPNWTAPVPRAAFFLLGEFAVAETERSDSELVGTQLLPSTSRVERFKAFMAAHPSRGNAFLTWLLDAGKPLLGISSETWLGEACDAIIGDNYPVPARCLRILEQPMKTYLTRELFDDRNVPMDLFPVEGGTAGICYLFDTLFNTGLLHKGDTIALFLPTFAPYLEIPKLPDYDFNVVTIKAQRVDAGDKTTYVYPKEEIEQLRDPAVKAAFVVNPSNPTANAMGLENISQIEAIVHTDRPDLMILTDDVYGTFVPHFFSLFAALPKNTACLYSFSKYFGATGWRVGAIAVAKENIFDELIAQLEGSAKVRLEARYLSLAADPKSIHFIDRLVADSREIALNHAAGLSTVQQVMMALFSLYGIMDEGQAYKQEVVQICQARERQLFRVLGMKRPAPGRDTAYYCDIELRDWAARRYGDEFADAVAKHWTITTLLISLFKREHLLVLKTGPFGSDTWSVRVSLANLPTPAYAEVGQRIIRLFDTLHTQWKNGDSQWQSLKMLQTNSPSV